VVIALLSLAVSGVSLITVLGQAAAIVVVVAVLASMTLPAALLGLCGDRIERLRVGRDRRPTLGHSGLAAWGERSRRRPASSRRSVVLLLAVPRRSRARLGLTDQSSAPTSSHRPPGLRPDDRRVRAGSNGPLLVMADYLDDRPRADDRACRAARRARRPTACRRRAPQVSKDGTAGLINVVPAARHVGRPRGLVDESRTRSSRPAASTPRRRLDRPAARPRRPDRPAPAADHRGRRRLSMLLLLIAFRSVSPRSRPRS
jgi:RND superfamily putative drug exporter